MSDAHQPPFDDDAWATACEEDLRAERARRRSAGNGSEPVDELRHFFDTVAQRLGQFGGGPAGWVAADAADKARAAVDPVLERHRDTIGHLARAGDEVAAAFRAAFTPQQQRDAEGTAAPEDGTRPGSGESGPTSPSDGPKP
ncbi:DUF5304 family protein [Streptomyces spiramenti]|uniref:DUF5304 domain-containing protein n=1 Tax=Streptomyces spiramenti TaxID=2720606 RepID=A0ABX1AXY9_9ACTN|nr:DUF5304 family protein [Streptomyces spiramenti]NJP69200.1 DUF5304 domain-containing protein [Streptomyces spiramenti]